MGCSADPRKKKMPDPQKIFELSYTADTFVYSKFLITVRETAEGAVFLQKCREDLERALTDFYAVFPQGIADPLDVPRRIPMHFVWNVKNIDWKKRLRKSHRSMLIRIVNLTTHLLVLDPRREEKERLEEGLWLEFPSDQIPPLCFTEFGCQSDGFLFGTGGSCTYIIPGRPGQFVFFWDQPGMGGCRSLGVHTGSAFRVFKHSENLNEGTIVFHIIDPSRPPWVQIVQARALHPQRLAALQASSSSRSSEARGGSAALQLASASSAAHREFLRDSSDLTASLIAYLRRVSLEPGGALGADSFSPGIAPHFVRSGDVAASSVSSGSTAPPGGASAEEPLGTARSGIGGSPSGGASGLLAASAPAGSRTVRGSSAPSADGEDGSRWAGSVEISLVSPRAFFCALQSTKTLRGTLQPNSLLYIQWRIGSELFERVFGPDERVYLHGGLVGGLEKNPTELILRAEPVSLRRLPPGLKVAEVYPSDSSGGISVFPLSAGAAAGAGASAGIRPVTSEGELLEVLVRGFRICASGLLREVSERMEAAFGVDWLVKCDLPRHHIWKDLLGNGEGEQIDLEGLLHIMTAFWDEVFEERLEDPQPLHAMQAVVIYWATQELAVLDGPCVFSFFETATGVLRKLGQTAYAQKLQELGRALDGTATGLFAAPGGPTAASSSEGGVAAASASVPASLNEGTSGSAACGKAASARA